MVEMVHIHHKYHEDNECAYFFVYDNDFGCIIEMGQRRYSSILVKLIEDEWVEQEKQHYSTFNEALLWAVKWRYYT